MVVRKTQPLPIECVVRGYVSGSGWKDYQSDRTNLRHHIAGRIAGVGEAASADFYAFDKSGRGSR